MAHVILRQNLKNDIRSGGCSSLSLSPSLSVLPENLPEHPDQDHRPEHDDLEENEAAGNAEHLDAAADSVHAVLGVTEGFAAR